ncbi:MAG TPA: chromosome segregation protein SMC, partial [Methylocystis sp.]
QLANLKKQARQAIRYRSISGDIRRAEATLYHLRWVAARYAEKETEAGQAQVARELADATHAEHVARDRREQAQQSLQPLRHAEAEANAALQRLKIEREQLEREARQTEARKQELESRLVQVDADAARDEVLTAEARTALGQLGEEAARLNGEAAGEGSELEAASLASEEAQKALRLADAETRRLSEELSALKSRRASLERDRGDAAARLSRIEAEIGQVEAESKGIALRMGEDRRVAERRAVLEAARAAADEAENAAGAAEQAASLAAAELESARPALGDTEAAMARLETEAKTIAKLLNVQDNSLWPPIFDALRVRPGYEAAMGAAFGEELDASTDGGAPIHWREPGDGASDHGLPQGVEPLADFVEGPALLKRKLRQIGVVDAAKGAELARSLTQGQVLVSRQGDVWRWDGFVARSDAPSAAAQRLSQRNRLADIDAELASLRQLMIRERARVDELASNLIARRQSEKSAREAWRAAAREIAAAQAGVEEIQKSLTELNSRQSALEEARTRLKANLAEARDAQASAEASIAMLASEAGAESALEEARLVFEALRNAADEARLRLAGLETTATSRRARQAQILDERATWERRLGEARAHLEALTTRRQEAADQLQALTASPAALAAKTALLDEHIDEAAALRSKAGDRVAAADATYRESDRASREAAEALSASRENAARFEERLA